MQQALTAPGAFQAPQYTPVCGRYPQGIGAPIAAHRSEQESDCHRQPPVASPRYTPQSDIQGIIYPLDLIIYMQHLPRTYYSISSLSLSHTTINTGSYNKPVLLHVATRRTDVAYNDR